MITAMISNKVVFNENTLVTLLELQKKMLCN